MATSISGVDDGELIRTVWGQEVRTAINDECLKSDGSRAMATGAFLTLSSATPTADNHAVRKKYVDDITVKSSGDTMTGRLIINPLDTAQCIILRSQLTGGGGSFTDTPYLSFYDHTQTVHYGYVQGSAARLHLVHATGDVLLDPGPSGNVTTTRPIVATGLVRGYANGGAIQVCGTSNNGYVAFYPASTSATSIGSLYGHVGFNGDGHMEVENDLNGYSMRLKTTGASALLFMPGGVERARVESDGNFFIGKITGSSTVEGIFMNVDGSMNLCRGEAGGAIPLTVNYQNSADNQHFIDFTRNGTLIGRIEQTGTTGSAMVSGSDRRMKTIVGPITNAVERIKALKPWRVTWNGDSGRGETDAFIADEVQSVVPEAVMGEPNAIAGPPVTENDPPEGSPIMQGMAYDKLITVTIAALQWALGEIETLTGRLDVVEAAA